MTVTATEFKLNMGKYFDIIRDTDETIYITKNGKKVAEFSRPQESCVEQMTKLLDDKQKKYLRGLSDEDIRLIALEEKYGLSL